MEQNQEPSGILLIDKPAGITSHDVVGRVRKLYGTRRVGHTGTLDPMATGVLAILVGRAAKAAEYLVSDRKHYETTLRLGYTTDTEDITGKVLTSCTEIPPAEKILETIAGFAGEYAQVPPMVSALKVGGKKLVDLARKGIEIERKPRNVTIFSIACEVTDSPDTFHMSIECSSGTYIRTLCADIGRQLGCGGVMASLRRTVTGGFTIERCHTTDELEAMDMAHRKRLLLPVESLFLPLDVICLPPFFAKLARSGCEIYQTKIKTGYPVGTRLRLADESGHFFALGEVREYPGGTALKALKLFEL